MVNRRRAAALALTLLPRHAFPLQVSPNSPCASVCVDRENLDLADPNSSNTHASDLTCKDAEYAKTHVGVKWQNCMTCLQTSSFYQGSESDQGWFLYNLRYNFNFCVFGYPNNTGIGSNPCQTSTACGALKAALLDGDMDARSGSDYNYCTAGGGAMMGEYYAKCLSCIHGFSDQTYVTNGLVALEAGCLHRPAPGQVLGLNGTIFSREQISIVDPATVEAASTGSNRSGTPTTIIAVASISSVIAVVAIAAIVFVCIRKRRNRRARAGSSGGRGHRPKSSLSFRCQTHLSPMSPKFFSGAPGSGPGPEDSPYMADDGGRRHIMSSPLRTHPGSTPWRPASSLAGSPLTPVADKQIGGGGDGDGEALSEKQQMALSEKQQQLHQLMTALPVAPRSVHTSPGTAAARSSPMTATPTSATQLLPTSGRLSTMAPYVPADYAGMGPGAGRQPGHHHHFHHPHGHTHSPVSPVVRQQGSPQLTSQQWGWAVSTNSPTGGPPPPPKSPRMSGQQGAAGGGGVRKGTRESGSPTESVAIQTSFPGPPMR